LNGGSNTGARTGMVRKVPESASYLNLVMRGDPRIHAAVLA
jgi:hypothetical protein